VHALWFVATALTLKLLQVLDEPLVHTSMFLHWGGERRNWPLDNRNSDQQVLQFYAFIHIKHLLGQEFHQITKWKDHDSYHSWSINISSVSPNRLSSSSSWCISKLYLFMRNSLRFPKAINPIKYAKKMNVHLPSSMTLFHDKHISIA